MVEQAIDNHCHCEAQRAVAISCTVLRYRYTVINIEKAGMYHVNWHVQGPSTVLEIATSATLGGLLAMTRYSEAGCVDLHYCHKR